MNYADPLTSLELLNNYLALAMSSGRFAHYVIQRNDITNDSNIHVSDGMQGVYSKMFNWLINFTSQFEEPLNPPKSPDCWPPDYQSFQSTTAKYELESDDGIQEELPTESLIIEALREVINQGWHQKTQPKKVTWKNLTQKTPKSKH